MRYVIPLDPVPAARARVTTKGWSYYPKRYSKFRRDFAKWLKTSKVGKFLHEYHVDLKVTVWCIIPPPAKTIRYRPPGDWDNYAKGVCDALNKMSYDDDDQICDGRCVKLWAEDGKPGEIIVDIDIERVHEPRTAGNVRRGKKQRGVSRVPKTG